MSVFVAFYHNYADSCNHAAFATDREMLDWLREMGMDRPLKRGDSFNYSIEVWPSGRSFTVAEFIERATESNG